MIENLSLITVGILPLIGISFAVKESIRKQHPLYGTRRIEVAHIQDEFLGGSGERSNLQPLSIPEHLADHVNKAQQATDWRIASRQYGAAHLIATRATPSELEEANALIANLPKKR
jgi:hypothetical protein